MKNNIIPQGDLLRQLLTKSNLTDSNINKLLREKGVFVGNPNKNNVVPLLMKSVISPNDFDYLYSAQKTKDETVKYRTATIKCSQDFDFNVVLNQEIPLHGLINDRYTYKPNYNVVGNPTFYYENKNHAVLEFEIEKENYLQGIYGGKTTHKGSISLVKDVNNTVQVSVQQNSTSKETLEVNKLIMNSLKERFLSKSLIKDNDDVVTIRFNHFNNADRILFFYYFANNFSIYTTFKSITDIDIFLDESVESHSDVKTFLNQIENLKLSGKSLQNHILLKKAKYYPKLILSSVKLRYKINYEGVECEAVISMGFPDYSKGKEDAEFQLSIDLIFEKSSRNTNNEQKVRKKLLEVFEHKKVESYERFRTKS